MGNCVVAKTTTDTPKSEFPINPTLQFLGKVYDTDPIKSFNSFIESYLQFQEPMDALSQTIQKGRILSTVCLLSCFPNDFLANRVEILRDIKKAGAHLPLLAKFSRLNIAPKVWYEDTRKFERMCREWEESRDFPILKEFIDTYVYWGGHTFATNAVHYSNLPMLKAVLSIKPELAWTRNMDGTRPASFLGKVFADKDVITKCLVHNPCQGKEPKLSEEILGFLGILVHGEEKEMRTVY